MKEVEGNLWKFYDEGFWIAITTNGDVKTNGLAVMGRGIALQAKTRFPGLAMDLGYLIRHQGNNCHVLDRWRLISFPVKHHFRDKADLKLIEKSCRQIITTSTKLVGSIYMPRPGCGNGKLEWSEVKPVIAPWLSDRFTIVEYPAKDKANDGYPD